MEKRPEGVQSAIEFFEVEYPTTFEDIGAYIESLERENDTARARIKELDKEVYNAEEYARDLKARVEELEKGQLHGKVLCLEAEIERNREEIERLKARVAELDQEAERLGARVTELLIERDQVKAHNEMLTKNLEAEVMRHAKTEKRASKAEEEVERLKAQANAISEEWFETLSRAEKAEAELLAAEKRGFEAARDIDWDQFGIQKRKYRDYADYAKSREGE